MRANVKVGAVVSATVAGVEALPVDPDVTAAVVVVVVVEVVAGVSATVVEVTTTVVTTCCGAVVGGVVTATPTTTFVVFLSFVVFLLFEAFVVFLLFVAFVAVVFFVTFVAFVVFEIDALLLTVVPALDSTDELTKQRSSCAARAELPAGLVQAAPAEVLTVFEVVDLSFGDFPVELDPVLFEPLPVNPRLDLTGGSPKQRSS